MQSLVAPAESSNCLDSYFTLEAVYLFPHSDDILMVQVDTSSKNNPYKELEPTLYAPENGVGSWIWMVTVHPDELGELELPEDYNGWGNAQLVYQKAA